MTKPTTPIWVSDNSPIPDPHGRGERAVKFFRALRHPKSTAPKRQFVLPDFWERIIRRAYGPSNADGSRQVRTVYVEIPRGARKTTIGAGLGLLHTFGPEKVPGGSCILAAGAEDQAQLAFDEATSFVNATPGLLKAAHIVESELELEHPASGSMLVAIPAEGDVQHGKTPHFVLIDELHVWKNRRLWKALRTGLLKTPNTMLVIITTAGRGVENLAYEEHKYALRVASGEIVNPAYLPIIFAAPRDCDWKDETIWHAVNPGLKSGFPDLVGMRQAALEAQDKPGDREDFKQYNLNIWGDHSTAPFVDMSVYDEGNKPVDLAELEGKPCWIGVDMGLTTDLTAVVAAWPIDLDTFAVWAWFFCPGDNLQGRADRDGVPYPQWAKDGFIHATSGTVTDHRAVEAHIRGLCERFRVMEIAFDPAYAQQVSGPLLDDGFPVVEFRQGWFTMSPAIKTLEHAIIGRNFRHGGHPILRWCFDNIAVSTDHAGNRKFEKGKSKDRIDGAVAAAMAVARAATGDTNKSSYDDAPDDVSLWAYV